MCGWVFLWLVASSPRAGGRCLLRAIKSALQEREINALKVDETGAFVALPVGNSVQILVKIGVFAVFSRVHSHPSRSFSSSTKL
jgi:hypothetical protein